MVLVTQPLTNDNYNSWKRFMLMALSAKNKLGFVNGSIVAPNPSSTELYNVWTKANNFVNSWILNSVFKEIAASLLYHSTATAIWKDLDQFQQSNGPRIFHFKKKLSELAQGLMYVSTYYTQLKIIWDELVSAKPVFSCLQCTCGGFRKMIHDGEREQTMQFLMGLHESYAHIRAQILLMDPLPSIAEIFSWILQEENQRSISILAPTPDAVFAVKASYATKKSRPQCTHCHLLGHTKDKCYKLHGYPSGNAGNVNSTSNINSTATDSLTTKQCQQLIAVLTTQLLSFNLVLKNVLFIPEFKFNLLAVRGSETDDAELSDCTLMALRYHELADQHKGGN
ncbi:hypothetical protein F3Y22_tig00005459pilonHSYRG00316 [Hibiscus syriacus]|uniref:Retrotransposon Copia-like N-terminal domain-containing protein n=1 Tax=Hibiscus syriacus TaxID=106335 RepID=A0A6A3CFY1_HIBSY|nr:hypothetical protein F3Y22_tig00005459pilonHSYRG00316 [Hibiscus syriacus]